MEMAGGGNLRDIYLECQHNVDIANRRAEKQGPLNAELAPRCRAAWYVLTTEPAHEKIAVGHLIGRRFGVYLPENVNREVRRGRVVDRARLLLPGYVFVFVWGIERHTRRLRAIPGVRDILCVNDHPAIVPDPVIDRLRATENQLRPIAITIDEIPDMMTSGKKKKKKKRRRHSRPHPSPAPRIEDYVIGVHAYSPFFEAMREESEEVRINAFHRLIAQFEPRTLTESAIGVSGLIRDAS